MRMWALVALLVACNNESAPAPRPTLRTHEVDELYLVIVPKGTDPAPTVRHLRALLPEAAVGALPIPAGVAIGVEQTGEPVVTLREMTSSVWDAAATAHGWVVDTGADVTYTAAEFETHIVGNVDMSQQIRVFESGGALRTQGMGKLGLPELTMRLATGHVKQAIVLVDAVAQAMLVQRDLQVPGTIDIDLATLPAERFVDLLGKGATQRARLRTTWLTVGDRQFIQLVPANGLDALIVECFGAAF